MNEKTLFDLCTKAETDRREANGRVSVMAFRKQSDGALQKKAYMERLLRDACEYAALRGEGGTEPLGLIHQVEVTPVRELNEDAILQLCMSVPAENRRKGVFLMNASAMYALHGKLSGGALKLITSDWQGFKILNRPVVLLNNMPCMGEGQVPILFGDFGSVYILSAGHEDMHEKPHGRHPSNVICTMEGYMGCTLSNREAVKGLKMV